MLLVHGRHKEAYAMGRMLCCGLRRFGRDKCECMNNGRCLRRTVAATRRLVWSPSGPLAVACCSAPAPPGRETRRPDVTGQWSDVVRRVQYERTNQTRAAKSCGRCLSLDAPASCRCGGGTFRIGMATSSLSPRTEMLDVRECRF